MPVTFPFTNAPVQASFVQEGESIDYTPAADTPAGQVVVQGSLVGITKRFIPAGLVGALTIVGVFDVVKGTGAGSGQPAGTPIYWDATNHVAVATGAAGANAYMGKSIAASTDAQTTVRVKVNQ